MGRPAPAKNKAEAHRENALPQGGGNHEIHCEWQPIDQSEALGKGIGDTNVTDNQRKRLVVPDTDDFSVPSEAVVSFPLDGMDGIHDKQEAIAKKATQEPIALGINAGRPSIIP